jgi:predicted ester cyclase
VFAVGDLKALAERFNTAFNNHDLDGLDAITQVDIELTTPGPQTVHGRAAAREFNKNWFDAFPDCKSTIVNIVAAGNTVVTEGWFEGTHTGTMKTLMGDVPATGKTLKGPYCQVGVVEGERFTTARLYYDVADIMIQLGLMPAPVGATS